MVYELFLWNFIVSNKIVGQVGQKYLINDILKTSLHKNVDLYPAKEKFDISYWTAVLLLFLYQSLTELGLQNFTYKEEKKSNCLSFATFPSILGIIW